MHHLRLIHLLFLLCWLNPSLLKAQAERNMLAGNYSQAFLSKRISMADIREAYPVYAERKKWEAIDIKYRDAIIAGGEAELNYTWQTVPATTYMEFLKTGDRYIMENIYNRNITAHKKTLPLQSLQKGKEDFYHN